MTMSNDDEFPNVEWSDQKRKEFRRKRRAKNYALLAVLAAFVVIVYFVALVRMGGS